MVYASDLAQKILKEHTDTISGFTEVTLLGYCDDYEAGETLSRYMKASEFASGIVLDCAAGCCYGSSVLRRNKNVDYVISVDVDTDLLMYGGKVYDADCVCADCAHLPFRENFFDSVVSVETLEHVKDQSLFLKEVMCVLKRDGILVLNTPNKLFASPFMIKPINPYHSKEHYLGTLDRLLRSCGFQVKKVWGQGKFSISKLTGYFIYSLLKRTFSLLGIRPIWVDKIYGTIKLKIERYNALDSIITEVDKVKKSVDPNPENFPYSEIKAISNFTLYRCFMFYCHGDSRLQP
jgi:ubiquinone/menaquinone biosynthesis C-methylase UbiE